MSDQIIRAPCLANGIAEAQYVCAGIITSSPFFNFKSKEIISKAAAAELTAKTFFFLYILKKRIETS